MKYSVQYPNGDVFSVDATEIYKRDARKNEIQAVGKITAPELMRAMEDGFTMAGKMHATLLVEVGRMQAELDRRRAEVMLDIVPEILKQKGLSSSRSPGGSEDQRNAVLALDTTYGKLNDCLQQLFGIKEILKVHMRGFELAFSAIKQAVGNQLGGVPFTPEQTEALVTRTRAAPAPEPKPQAAQPLSEPSGEYESELAALGIRVGGVTKY